ncbi:aminomethyltransferase [Eremomyces bilateralis CBS 781.70]|uniref:Aminomethyltransferase n=1 Tax=Eremomyces bilateralis CBS 781.70 TaxID=1392243 RepID=A0A6G1GGC6_9PEZI|nr:aminomethyltransferase [Eremomyces bilateralis CBS 781.70]KAF1817118.1 aminomethyltransferase [Eremomyces bilateralis CBS 781.70]
MASRRVVLGVRAIARAAQQYSVQSRTVKPTSLLRNRLPTSPHPAVPSCAAVQTRWASSATDPNLKKTRLYDLHVANGGQMVPFSGYSMPVQYKDLSIVQSHLWTREKASLFDVSHMLQHHFSGPGAAGFLSLITPSSLSTLPTNQSTLSCLLHPETGGIIDDTIITKLRPELFYVVTNAGCREKDTAYLQTHLDAWTAAGHSEVTWTPLPDNSLLALQGPLSSSILSSLLAPDHPVELQKVLFGQCVEISIQLPNGDVARNILASRGGYTGEDGFELSLPPAVDPHEVASTLLQHAGPDQLRLAGLAARDSLRLEAGMCLYGNDLDETTTPVEAGLGWVIGKDRRANGGFHGADTILGQLKLKKDGGTGVARRRVGLTVEGAPARAGAEIVVGGEKVGVVTSGCPSPSLRKNIAMGYVKSGLHKAGTEVGVVVRGKERKATVTKMPFVPSRYWKGAAPA